MLNKSKYFDFKNLVSLNDKVKISNFVGWSGLSVTKFIIKKNTTINVDKINEKFPFLIKKEKIFITIEGEINFKTKNKIKKLKKFDVVNLKSGNHNFEINAQKKSTFFMIGAQKSKINRNKYKTYYFNFLDDIKSKNLWGGQIISRPYEGEYITLVLFDLKSGFKFEDKGHANEQITWLIKGNMNFYVKNNGKSLSSNSGVSIGPNQIHGGKSKGAIGFDAFFPKRKEKKYRKN